VTHVLHRQINHTYPVAESARGITIRDTAGKDYIDASGGAAVSCLGHSHPDIIAAMRAQLERLEYAHTSFFTSQAAEALADDLVAHAPDGLGHAFFVSGGSEAIEAALKLARQYFVERGEPQRRFLVARRQSYHGVTLGALAVGGREWQRRQFSPLLIETHHVSPVYEYRERHADETSEAYGERLARELDAKVEELGGRNVIAFVAETVVGATLGAVPAVPGYFRRVREICDRHGILLILDEVMCGMGRTGTLHACEQEGVSPDILAIAKGLGGGYAPIGAILLQERIFKTLADGSGAFQHSHTYTGWPGPQRSRCSRSFGATICSPMSASRASIWRGGCRSGSATIPLSAMCAAAACFRGSRSSPTAAPKSLSIRSANCMRRSSVKRWRAG
jgi:adenosylmethionine-8-amino-7-oxononanoate aminotransferase